MAPAHPRLAWPVAEAEAEGPDGWQQRVPLTQGRSPFQLIKPALSERKRMWRSSLATLQFREQLGIWIARF
jgi:hypothetical protein